VVKLRRVHGGCLGVQSRRRSWYSCDKPRGAVKQALIRGSPNRETGRDLSPVSECTGNAGN